MHALSLPKLHQSPSINLSNALLAQLNHQRLGLVGQISAIVGPVLVILVDEGELERPDDSGEDEARFREEGPAGHSRVSWDNDI